MCPAGRLRSLFSLSYCLLSSQINMTVDATRKEKILSLCLCVYTGCVCVCVQHVYVGGCAYATVDSDTNTRTVI